LGFPGLLFAIHNVPIFELFTLTGKAA